MAQINVTGDMIQIKTNITESEYEVISHYSPETLKIVDEKGNDVFSIAMGAAHYSKYGVTFCNSDAEGKLFMTANNPVTDHSDPAKERKLIAKELAQTINNLRIIEAQVEAEKPKIAELVQNANEVIHMTGCCDDKVEG